MSDVEILRELEKIHDLINKLEDSLTSVATDSLRVETV